MAEPKYKIKFIGHEKSDHVKYFMDITDMASNKAWTKKERYSKIRQMHSDMKNEVGSSDMPQFPSRRWWGNLQDEFVSQRQHELENYFSTITNTSTLIRTRAFQTFINSDKIMREEDDPSSDIPNKPTPSPSVTTPINPFQLVYTKTFQNALAKACNIILENANSMFIDLSSNPNPIEADALNEREDYYLARLPSKVRGAMEVNGKVVKGADNVARLNDASAPSANLSLFSQFDNCFVATNGILGNDKLFELQGESIIHAYN
eukprot:CAMPEP_0114974038 /NCGR_PEP_ID=MMETSP0216-20121206/1300_1 /TAXON_ID=223996 /ORGANISM="Protocruzia adherens, Strain Boccale" /LENGTH=261 /DNA_ID=CAMNT_0002334621 /DNA_START=39 /DNA_END=824 /DNA_ORIENTATION=+